MAFGPAWRQRAAARLSPHGGRVGASGSVPDARPRSIEATQRLRQRKDFVATATGTRASASGFVLQARNRGDEGPARMGFTLSRKVGTAVERNRARRRLKEVAKLFAAQHMNVSAAQHMNVGYDYVLVGRREALTLSFALMLNELERAFERVHEGRQAQHPPRTTIRRPAPSDAGGKRTR